MSSPSTHEKSSDPPRIGAIDFIETSDLDKDSSTIFGHIDKADIDGIKRVLKDGFDIETENDEGLTPLCYAISIIGGSGPAYKKTEIVETLLKNGADPNRSMDMDDVTPIMDTSRYSESEFSISLMKLLLAHGADPNRRKHPKGDPPNDADNQR